MSNSMTTVYDATKQNTQFGKSEVMSGSRLVWNWDNTWNTATNRYDLYSNDVAAEVDCLGTSMPEPAEQRRNGRKTTTERPQNGHRIATAAERLQNGHKSKHGGDHEKS